MERLTSERAEDLLHAIVEVHVLVVGDIMLDRMISGTAERISPEAPVPVVTVSGELASLGGAANVAANIVAMGASCSLVGLCGADESGLRLRSELQRLGIDDSSLVEAADRPTTTKTRVLAGHHQVVRVDREDTTDIPEAQASAMLDSVEGLLGKVDAVALQDYNKGVLVPSVIHAVLSGAGAAGMPSVVDPKKVRFFGYAGSTVFKPNAGELADALGEPLHSDDPDWMEATRARLDCRALLLTLGSSGMALKVEGKDYVRVPTVARSVFDVSGAGDTVTATVAVSLAAGASQVEAALLANHAAAIEVGRAGVSTVRPQDIVDHIRVSQSKRG
jgi:rfaE bifunctional protein kinase chain/domain